MQRAPIVVILGHVDHGKTTLLDTLQKSRITQGEAGGITQSIGAYQVTSDNRKITFIDTPGHAAFAAMRQRGARVADLAILVISATDGVQPQTLEALDHIKASGIPYIVAINKIDLPEADIVRVKTQLAEHESAVEGFGGTVPVVEISALKGDHIPDLLEMVSLVFELQNITSESGGPLEAPVIESKRDTHLGPVASIVVRNGSLRVGDRICASGINGKVRAILNDRRERVAACLPGEPGLILGFTDVVPVGAVVTAQGAATAKTQPSRFSHPEQAQTPRTASPSPDAPMAFGTLILKADTQGTLEALGAVMPEGTHIVSRGIGDINESDILLAESTKASIVGFRVNISTSVNTLSQTHKVSILTHDIIYKLLEQLEELMAGPKRPAEVELGRAKILKIFRIDHQDIAGCTVESGRLILGDRVHVETSGSRVTNATVSSLRQGKAEIKQVKAGQECGVLLRSTDGNVLNLSEGNDIIAYQIP